jgi:hypothetical protein
MFYSLGHIIHLNQDVSQPDHSRDDQHASRPYIEDFGGSSYENHPEWFNPKPHGWAYWRVAGFKRLLDFWDRDRFKGGSAAALIAEATGAPQHMLGLAEFSNGNFLGEDALYAENFQGTNDTHYFPFPSLTNTDQAQLKAGGWWSFMDSSILADGTQVLRPFIKKTGAGVTVEHHSVIKYLGAMNMGKMGSLPGASAISIDAPEVLKDYHDILVPKAIEYSAGILDYFFRGQIDYSIVAYSPSEWVITVKNVSGESFKGGMFCLYVDDTAGNRTELTSVRITLGANEILADGETREFSLNTPPIANAKYMIVYQGTIGLTGTTASDPVDAEKAIAVKQICCLPENGSAVPDPLEIPVNLDMGTATIIKDPVSFGNMSAGRYQIEYVQGAIHLVNSVSGTTFTYLTKYLHDSNYPEDDFVRVYSSPGLGGPLQGTWGSSISSVETATLAANPVCVGNWDGGQINLTISDTYSLPGEHIYSLPGATYRLRKTATGYQQPPRVRIQNWETEIKPKISICETCPASVEDEWDGTFPDFEASWNEAFWTSFEEASLNGRRLGWISVGHYQDQWFLYIECDNGDLIWYGTKVVGTDGAGKYLQNLEDAPNQCATNLKCITIESY